MDRRVGPPLFLTLPQIPPLQKPPGRRRLSPGPECEGEQSPCFPSVVTVSAGMVGGPLGKKADVGKHDLPGLRTKLENWGGGSLKLGSFTL